MTKVFVHTWAPDDVLTDLNALFAVDHVDVFKTGPLPAEVFAERMAGNDGILVLTPLPYVDGTMIANNAGTLKVIANVAVGVDNIDVDAATRNGVLVTNTPGVLTHSVADMALGLVLAVARRIVESDAYTRAGKFQGPSFPLFWGADVHGETLGIVGMGRIGQEVARRAAGFDMNIVYHNRTPLDGETEAALGANWLSLDDLLATARYVVLLTPLTAETTHLISGERLRQMRDDGYLINVARGPVVHEVALLEALRNKQIAGAALDVYEFEPKVTDGLTDLDNLVLTPHIASGTVKTRHAMVRLAADNLIAALTGKPVPSPFNRVG